MPALWSTNEHYLTDSKIFVAVAVDAMAAVEPGFVKKASHLAAEVHMKVH